MSEEHSTPHSHSRSIDEVEADVRRGIVARRDELKRRAERLPTLPAPLKEIEFRFLQRYIDLVEEEEAELRTIFPDL